VIAVGNRSLWWAAEAILQALPPEKLSKLNVSAGEHLAAILTTAFLGAAPSDIDATGGADLTFRLSPTRQRRGQQILSAGQTELAFEVKSLPGPHREWAQSLERDQDRVLATVGRTRKAIVRSANDVLQEALPMVRRATSQLQRKTTLETSKNVFLVVHPLDHLVLECIEHAVIGPLLGPMEGVDDLHSVWVLWAPDHLTVWSRNEHEWIDLLFRAATPEEARSRDPEQLAVLQEVESHFLARLGHTRGSPYRFGLSAE
jgi:hypothetical protein